MFDNAFMDFMGYRNSIVEEKIKKCLAAARQGKTSIEISADDLTDSEIEYIKKEVERRIKSGKH